MGKAKKWYVQHASSAVELLPIVLPVGLAAFGAVATSLLLLDALRSFLVVALGVPVALVAVIVTKRHYKKVKRPGSRQEQLIFDLLIAIAVLAWVVVNLNYASQNVFVNRDPAVYNVTGAWLVNHDNLQIPISDAFGFLDNLRPVSLGFGFSTIQAGELFAQGLHLLPIFVGLTGRLLDEEAMLRMNVVFGGIAILAVYGFARLLAKPRWAALTCGTLGLSLPLIYFSRNTFTEPLALVFTFGALSLLWAAQSTKSLPLWFIAGFTAGAGALTRIDAYVTFIAIAAFSVLLLALSKARERKLRATSVGVFSVGALITSILGWLDMTRLSSGYYEAQNTEFEQQLLALAIVIIAGAFFVLICWRTKILSLLDKKTKSWRAPMAFLAIFLLAAFFASRPHWYVSHAATDNSLVRSLQAVNGKHVDGTRDYAEQTATWIAWYIGPAVAILGVGGLALSSAQAVRRKDTLLVPSILVIVGTSAVFLMRPSITPDQVWAARRLLPVILPGVAVFAAVALDYLWDARFIKVSYKRKAVSFVVLAVVLPVLFSSYPILRKQTYASELRQIREVCAALPENAAVLWAGPVKDTAVQTTRTFCNVPTAGALSLDGATLQKVAANSRSKGYEPLVAFTPTTQALLSNSQATVVSDTNYLIIPSTLYAPPRAVATEERIILIGRIQPDGTILPLARNL